MGYGGEKASVETFYNLLRKLRHPGIFRKYGYPFGKRIPEIEVMVEKVTSCVLHPSMNFKHTAVVLSDCDPEMHPRCFPPRF